jgi:hypothetical protein
LLEYRCFGSPSFRLCHISHRIETDISSNMKFYRLAIAALAGTGAASPVEIRQSSGGDGPYKPAKYTTDSSLPQHTIYLPGTTSGTTKWPVFIWGNGGCGADGLANVNLLTQIASYGYIAIASGAPHGSGSTTSALMKQSIDWVTSHAGQGAYANVDASKIMTAGFSCGGVEAYDQIWDARVKTVGIFSSGLLSNQSAAQHFNKPILYCLGGSGDIAYQNGERDFHALPANTPSWKGNLPVGHGGTLFDANGGKFGKAGLNWLEWYFKNSSSAANYFASGYKSDGWTVETHALNQLKPLA